MSCALPRVAPVIVAAVTASVSYRLDRCRQTGSGGRVLEKRLLLLG